MAARKKTAIVAYEGSAELRWHRDRRGLRADGRKGRYYIVARKGRIDRRRGVFPWVVLLGDGRDTELGSKDRIDEAKKLAASHDRGAAETNIYDLDAYKKRVHAALVAMKSPSPDQDVSESEAYIFKMQSAGVDASVTAGVIFATKHHGHFGGPKHSEFTAEESPTRGEWEVVVMGVPPNLRDAVSAMAPAGASQVGSALVLHGFYDDEKATAVARRITHQYGLLATSGAKRWVVAAEKTLEARDSAVESVVEIAWDFDSDAKRFAQVMPATSAHGHVSRTVGSLGDVERALKQWRWRGEYTIRGRRTGASECQPFTKLVRDPSRFNACMLKSKSVGPIENSRGIYDVVVDDLSKQDQECFVVLCIDFRGAVRDYVEVARGQRHRVAVDPEDVLRPVLLSGCDGYAVIHNHPSGIAEPSDADGDFTKRIRRASEVACPNVKFVDHVVVGRGQFYSFADKKLHRVR